MTAPQLGALARRPRIALAILALALASPVAAADFQIDGLKLDLGAFAISAPKIEVRGSSLEREAFASLFNAGTGESVVSRMSKLNAAEISAPELVFEQAFGMQKQVTRYRDVRFSEVNEGRIGRGVAGGASLSGASLGTGIVSGELKRFAFEGLDLKHIARVLTERAQPGVTEAMLPLFGRFEQDGYTIDMGAAGKMSLGKMSGRGFMAKVGDEPVGDLLSRAVQMSEAAEQAARRPGANPPTSRTDEERRIGLSLLSLYESFSYGSGEARDIAMTLAAPPKPGGKAEMVEMRMARMTFGEDAPAKSGVAIERLQFAGGGGKGMIDQISHSGFSAGAMIRELKDLLAKPDAPLDDIDFRKFVPTIGTIRVSGLSVEAPQERKSGQPAPPPIKIGLGSFELKAGEQLNGIPTSVSMAVDKLVVPVTDAAGNPAARDMIAMGYRMVDLSAKLDLAWDAARSELAIRTISFGGVGMGQIEMSGTLGNVTKDLFSSDLALAQVAALGATARSLQATLQNAGLVEKLIENQAQKTKRKVEDVRREIATMASLGLSVILGPSDAAKILTAAIARFVARPGTLSVQASAKSASGLGLADVITLADPTEIFDKIDLKADAQ